MTSGLQLKQKRSRVAVIAEQREATTVTHSHSTPQYPAFNYIRTYIVMTLYRLVMVFASMVSYT